MALTENNRLEWIDQLRGFLMFMVFLTHLHSPLWLCQLMYPIFLTGFFTLSGYLYKKKKLKQHLVSLFNTLLFPFFLYSVVISLYEFVRSGFSFSNLCDSFYNAFFLGGDQLWFIPCLLIIELIFFLYKEVFDKPSCDIILITICFASFWFITSTNPHHLPWNLDTSIWCMGFYAVGAIPLLKKKIPNWVTCFLVLFYLLLSIGLGYWNLDCGSDDIHMNMVHNHISYIVLSVFGCYTMIHIFPLLPKSKLLSELGRYTLFAFPFQPYVLKIFTELTLKVLPIDLYEQFYSIVIIILAIISSIIFVLAGNALSKYCPLMLGKVKILNINR